MAPVTPAETFRILLLALSPNAKADEIDSYGWFHHAYNRREDCTQEEIDNATRAIKLLCERVRSGEIPLRGTFEKNKPAISIDPSEQWSGELNVFEAKLECYADVNAAWPARMYFNVHCFKSDVDKIVESITKEKMATAPMPPATEVTPPPSPEAPAKRGPGRRTDRDRVVGEAKSRMKIKTYPSIQALARELHGWLDKLPDAIRGVTDQKVGLHPVRLTPA
jgi:hypothetical protein